MVDMPAGVSVSLIAFRADADETLPDIRLVSTMKRKIRLRGRSIEDFDSRMRARAS